MPYIGSDVGRNFEESLEEPAMKLLLMHISLSVHIGKGTHWLTLGIGDGFRVDISTSV